MTAVPDTIEAAADALRAGTLSCAALLDATIARLRATEPHVHAWAHLDLDRARETAAQLDAELERGQPRGPLHGIPVGVKDVIDAAGCPSEAGSRVLRGRVPTADAASVAHLRAAGAVIVGKTVTHEFAYGQDEPPTRCPWDLDCYPGGSSAGSGVAVAVGSALAALGTDTGGSIRNPASVNGIVGLKPTNGRVSRRGLIPVSPTLDQIGPLTRTVGDCALVLSAIAGGDAGDPTASPQPVADYRAALGRPVDGARIGVDRAAFADARVGAEAVAAVAAALETLASLGAEIVEVAAPELAHALPAGLTVSLAEASEWHRELLRARPADYVAGTRTLLQLGELVPATDVIAARRVCRRVARATRQTFERHRLDALAGPVLPGPTLPLRDLAVDLTRDGDAADLSGALRLLIGANVTGLPAVSVPCGSSRTGLPLGLHLMGRPFGEAPLLNLAHAYEQATDWHVRRPPLPHA